MPPTQWIQVNQWIIGLVGALSIALLVLSTIVTARKAFGRKPPLDEQLGTFNESLRTDMQNADARLQEQIDSLNKTRREDQADMQRSVSTLYTKIESLREDVMTDGARRTDSTNTEIRKLAQALSRLDERTAPGGSIGI